MTDRKDDIGSSGKSVALEHRQTESDGRRYSPSVARNAGPIAEVFAEHMPLEGRILEIASGTGEHGAILAARYPGLSWVYSDVDGISMESQRAWVRHGEKEGISLIGPMPVDASEANWQGAAVHAPFAAIFCANMVHIAPFAAGEGLLRGAGQYLAPRGKLFLYGPFSRNGEIAPSNARFSEDLKHRDPDWGVRDLDRELVPIAESAGLQLETVIEMPANNLSVIFTR